MSFKALFGIGLSVVVLFGVLQGCTVSLDASASSDSSATSDGQGGNAQGGNAQGGNAQGGQGGDATGEGGDATSGQGGHDGGGNPGGGDNPPPQGNNVVSGDWGYISFANGAYTAHANPLYYLRVIGNVTGVQYAEITQGAPERNSSPFYLASQDCLTISPKGPYGTAGPGPNIPVPNYCP